MRTVPKYVKNDRIFSSVVSAVRLATKMQAWGGPFSVVVVVVVSDWTPTDVSGSEFDEEERPADGVTGDVVCVSSL